MEASSGRLDSSSLKGYLAWVVLQQCGRIFTEENFFWKSTQQKGLDVLQTLLFLIVDEIIFCIQNYKDDFWVMATVPQWVMWLQGFLGFFCAFSRFYCKYVQACGSKNLDFTYKIHKNEPIKSCTCHCKNLLLLLHDKF